MAKANPAAEKPELRDATSGQVFEKQSFIRMNDLSDALKRFNRKERNLLFLAVLGDEQKPLSLSDEFREEITRH